MRKIETLIDAFIALRDVDDSDVRTMMKPGKLTEGKAFPLSSTNDVLDKAKETIEEAPVDETDLEVIDVDADSVQHLKKKEEYVGQGILQCVRCKSNHFVNMEDLVVSEDDTIYNIEDECPHCKASGYGFELIGQVGKVGGKEEQPAEEAPVNPEDVSLDLGGDTEETTTDSDEVTSDEATATNDEVSDEEVKFDNDAEADDEVVEEPTEEENKEEENKNNDVFDLDNFEPEEKDGMETTSSEDEDDLDLPELGDEVEESFKEDSDEEDNYVKDAIKEDLNEFASKAWMMNQVVAHMNNEEAYYGGWLYIWPDGETKEQCEYDFSDEESFSDLEETFNDTYKEYHEDGLYNAPEDVEAFAHEMDTKLGLDPIVNIKPRRAQEALMDKGEEEDYVPVVEDLMDSIIEPENIKSVTVKECSEDDCVTVFEGTSEDLPENLSQVEFVSFNVSEGHLVCNINKDVQETDNPLNIFLDYFDDEETNKISVVDVETSEELFEGTKAEVLEKFGDADFVSCEAPEKIVLTVKNSGLDEVKNNNTEEDDLIEEICEANGLAAYRVSNPRSDEYWIRESIRTKEDLDVIYEHYIRNTTNHLTHKFKAVTGYKDELDIVAEKYGVDIPTTKTNKIVEKVVKTESTVKSFKDRKELAQAINECKTNNRPYIIKRSLTEGYRYDLVESSPEEAEPIEAKKFEDGDKTEVFTELPDYKVEVEQKGDKIEIELEPKEPKDFIPDEVNEPSEEEAPADELPEEEPVKEAINEVIEEDGKYVVTGDELKEVIVDALKEFVNTVVNLDDFLNELKTQAVNQDLTYDEAEARKYAEEALKEKVKVNESQDLTEAKKDDEEIDKITDSMEKVETIIGLIDDEVEAVDGYTDAIETIDDSKIPNKEEIISKLHHIKGEELEHIDELREVETLMPSVGELADEPEKKVEPIEEEPVDEVTNEPVDEIPEPSEVTEESLNENNNKPYKVVFINEGVEQDEFEGCLADCENHVNCLKCRAEDDECDMPGTFEIRPIIVVVDSECDTREPKDDCCEPECHVCPKCGKEVCECPHDDECCVNVDTCYFDNQINKYFDEAYEEPVIYHSTSGEVQADGKILLEGKIESDLGNANVKFTLTPEKELTESLLVENAESILKTLKYKVTNDLSDEVFTFDFENENPNLAIFDFGGKMKEEILKDFEKMCGCPLEPERIDDVACWEFERHKDFYTKRGMDYKHIKNALLTNKVND